ncbi:O-antigen ligase family protein [Otoolea muris]|uniref:O-antigen ligase family protein n=1 Tax=Otoolea muris TaxID=2941515 RepID=UPI00203D1F86|nr:O-antigen ligase family protein [Otoolea muris]
MNAGQKELYRKGSCGKEFVLRYGARTLIRMGWGMRWSFVLLVLYMNMLNLIPMPGTFGVRANVILPMLLGNSLFITVCLSRFCWVKRSPFWKWLIGFTFFLILNIFYTWLAYPGEPVINAVKTFSTFTVLFTYFVFLKAAEEDLDRFLHMIIALSSLLAALFLLQAVAYNLKEIQFLSIYGFNYGTVFLDFRNGHIRLIASDLVDFSAVVSIGCICSGTILPCRKKRYWIHLLLVLFYELFVGQTRAVLLIIAGAGGMSLLFMKRKNTAGKIITVFIMIFGVILLADDMFYILSKLLSSVTSRTDYSMYHRIDSYVYYLKIMAQKPFFGIGLLPAYPLLQENNILVSGGRQYTFSDVGIAGVAGKLGLTGVIFYIIPIWTAWKRYIVSGRKDRMNFVLCWGMILAMLSLSLFDAERMMVLAVFMAVSDASYQRFKKERDRHDGCSQSACHYRAELSGV